MYMLFTLCCSPVMWNAHELFIAIMFALLETLAQCVMLQSINSASIFK